MADRANIEIDGINFFFFWGGTFLPVYLQRALAEGHWETGGLVDAVLNHALKGEFSCPTGGIHFSPHSYRDGDGRVLRVSTERQLIEVNKRCWTFEEFLALTFEVKRVATRNHPDRLVWDGCPESTGLPDAKRRKPKPQTDPDYWKTRPRRPKTFIVTRVKEEVFEVEALDRDEAILKSFNPEAAPRKTRSVSANAKEKRE